MAGREDHHRTGQEKLRVLHSEYLSPHSRHLYLRLLKGEGYFTAASVLSVEDISVLPEKPNDAYERLQYDWDEKRSAIDISVDAWAKKAAKATMSLITSAEKDTQDVLKKTFAGWGITIQDDPKEGKDAMAYQYATAFYEKYCGMGAEDGMASLATQLIETFISNQPSSIRSPKKTEEQVLLALEGLKDWLKKFYGTEKMQEAFSACVKAQLAYATKRFAENDIKRALNTSLHEEDSRVLETLQDIALPGNGEPQETTDKDDQMYEADAEEAVEAEKEGERAIPLGTNTVLVEENEIISDTTPLSTEPLEEDSFATAVASSSQAIATAEIVGGSIDTQEDRAMLLHQKREDYYAVRLELLHTISELKNGKQAFDLDEVAQVLWKSPMRLLLDLRKIAFGKNVNASIAIDEIIQASSFLPESFIDFGFFTISALRDIRQVIMRICAQRSIPDSIAHLLSREDREKFDEESARQLVSFMEVLQGDAPNEGIKQLLVENMLLLPTMGDQLYYLLSEDSYLFELYHTMREKTLEEELARVRLGNIVGALGRRTPPIQETEDKEFEETPEDEEDEDFIPPLPSDSMRQRIRQNITPDWIS